jgi:PAS domain S-box-containing protein
MNIKNQIRLGVLVSLVIVAIISVSAGVSLIEKEELLHQEDLAADVVRGSYELTYLANDYIINGEPRARIQWEDRYASLGPIISGLKPNTVKESESLTNIRDYYKRVGVQFREIPEPSAISPGATRFSPGLQQVTWSRMNVQSQGMIYEAWRLRHLYNDDVNDARNWNNLLMLALMAAMLVIISINYTLLSRRLMRSIGEVIAGSEIFATGNLDYRIPVISDDEIGGIAQRLNTMAEQIHMVTASRDELNREISERKRSEEALHETNEYLRNLLDYANAPIIVWDPQFRITRFNHAFEHLTGRTEQEVLGKNLEILFPSKTKETSLELIRKTLAGERWETVEIPILHISGEFRTVLWNSANILDREGRIMSTIAQGQDITDRKMTEMQREALIRELEVKNAELERFTYTVSHDLKSPLITIRGFAGMIEQDVQNGDFLQLKKDLDRINAAADTMQELLSDVLELSRIGRIISPPEKIPFSVIAREAADLLAGQISKRGVTLEIAPDLPEVNVDRTRIREVLVNLLENAVKFSGNRPDSVIRVGVDRSGEMPVFFVQDNGIGIEPNYIGRIFNLFEKLDPSYPGTGVGLTIVKRIIEVHGGKIWAESGGLGKGTTFRFTLPVAAYSGTDNNNNR